jgi:hypothetical protein
MSKNQLCRFMISNMTFTGFGLFWQMNLRKLSGSNN